MVHLAAQLHFDKMIIKCISHKSVPGDFPTEDLTPEYEHYHGHTIEEDQDNAYEEGLPDNNDLHPLPTLEAAVGLSAQVRDTAQQEREEEHADSTLRRVTV